MRKQIWNSKYGGIGGQIKTDVHLPGLISQLVKKSKIILLGVAAMAFGYVELNGSKCENTS